MKIETNDKVSNVEPKDRVYASAKTDNDVDFADYVSISNEINNLFNSELTAQYDLYSVESDIADLKSSFKYDLLTMDKDDAQFFMNTIKKTDFALNPNATPAEIFNVNSDDASVLKSANVSKTLLNMLTESMNNSRPVKIDFGNDISAILRVSPSGKISAEFIPSDKAAEEYLRNNISFLRDSFDDNEIPYDKIVYGKYRQPNGNGKRKGENK